MTPEHPGPPFASEHEVTTMAPDRLRIKELHEALRAKADEINRISSSWKIEEGGVVVTAEQRDAYAKAIAEAEEIKALIQAEEKAVEIRQFLAQPEGVPTAGQDAAETGRAATQHKSLGQRWLESEEYAAIKAGGFRNPSHTVTFDGPLEVKDVYSTMAGTIPINALGSAQNLGLTERPLRPGRVRDLFPAERTSANLLYGIREVGFTNNARVVPERTAEDGGPATGGPTDVFGLKPKSTLQIVPVTYPLATIAHVMYVHRQTLADEPRIRGLIDRDLIDGVKLVEDEQILYGDGVGDNLTGIINTPGVQTYTGNPSDPRTAQIRRAITRAVLAYYRPTGVVVHPLDWEELELETTNDGAYRLAVNIAIGAQTQLWRLNVVDTVAMQEGTFLLGAFGTGAKLYDREQVNISVSTENRDFFERNAVTLRAEERLALVVDRPESFVVGEFASA